MANEPKGVTIVGSGRGSFFAKIILQEKLRKVVAMVDTNAAIHESLRKRFSEDYNSSKTALNKHPAGCSAKNKVVDLRSRLTWCGKVIGWYD